jgi:hypothetical protein
MSSRARAVPAADSVPGTFEGTSSLQSHAKTAASIACPAVLLVGRNGSWGSVVLKSLEKIGCELSFEVPEIVTPRFAKNGAYDLILLDSTVPPEQRRHLASELIGTETSIFYTFPVENGCWWLPALRCGRDCHGAPAFRRKEFPSELERMLRDDTEAWGRSSLARHATAAV